MITLENLTLSNPGEVLAVCGLFVLATRQDRSATLAWTDSGAVIDTTLELADLLNTVRHSNVDTANSDKVYLGDMVLDWWVHNGYKTPRSNFWTARVKPTSLISKSHAACKDLPDWYSGAVCEQTYGADSYSTWTKIDIGWSPNNITKVEVSGRPWVELLCMVALQAFTPRISVKDFRYTLWSAPLALTPARLVFLGLLRTKQDGISTQTWCADIAYKGDFKILRYANKE